MIHDPDDNTKPIFGKPPDKLWQFNNANNDDDKKMWQFFMDLTPVHSLYTGFQIRGGGKGCRIRAKFVFFKNKFT